MFLVACKLGPQSMPPPSPPPPPPAPPPVTEMPPPERFDVVAVAPIRAVPTDRVPVEAIDDLSRQLVRELGPSAQPLDIQQEGGCTKEPCRLDAATTQGATHLLHTRLVQYEGDCLLLSVLYEVPTKKSAWGFVRELPCDASGLPIAVSELTASFAGRPLDVPDRTMFAVAPVQHRIRDLEWASESFGEYMTTLLAEAGYAVTPASVVAQPMIDGGQNPHRDCRRKKCTVSLGINVLAPRVVATELRKQRRKKCSMQSSIWDVGTTTSTRSAKARGGCEAQDIARGLREIVATFAERPLPEDMPMDDGMVDSAGFGADRGSDTRRRSDRSDRGASFDDRGSSAGATSSGGSDRSADRSADQDADRDTDSGSSGGTGAFGADRDPGRDEGASDDLRDDDLTDEEYLDGEIEADPAPDPEAPPPDEEEDDLKDDF